MGDATFTQLANVEGGTLRAPPAQYHDLLMCMPWTAGSERELGLRR
jgi:hypothetical protein